MEFLEKNKKRGSRHAKSVAVRITRAHKKIHLGEEIREKSQGAKAPGILAKTGIKVSRPAHAERRDLKIKVGIAISQSVFLDDLRVKSAAKGFREWGLPEKAVPSPTA